MRKIIIFSHGELAKGMMNTLSMIIGDMANVEAYCAYIDEAEAIDQTIRNLLEKNQKNELIVVTDIFGGSVNNEWMKVLPENKNVYLIAGMSLPLLIQLITALSNSPTEPDQLIQTTLQEAGKSLVYCNKLELNMVDETDF